LGVWLVVGSMEREVNGWLASQALVGRAYPSVVDKRLLDDGGYLVFSFRGHGGG
jgi:hypothetical protein